MVLRHLLYGRDRGFYVDVGAWHPWRSSNTYGLYLRGWRGINIDARPGSMTEFRSVRRRDINLESAVGTREGRATYYHFTGNSSLNGLDRKFGESRGYRVTHTEPVTVRRLDAILSEYLPPGVSIDVLNVDVEGSDLDVLESNDWDQFRPGIVVVEDEDGKPAEFLKELGYIMVAELPISVGDVRTLIFVGNHT